MAYCSRGHPFRDSRCGACQAEAHAQAQTAAAQKSVQMQQDYYQEQRDRQNAREAEARRLAKQAHDRAIRIEAENTLQNYRAYVEMIQSEASTPRELSVRLQALNATFLSNTTNGTAISKLKALEKQRGKQEAAAMMVDYAAQIRDSAGTHPMERSARAHEVHGRFVSENQHNPQSVARLRKAHGELSIKTPLTWEQFWSQFRKNALRRLGWFALLFVVIALSVPGIWGWPTAALAAVALLGGPARLGLRARRSQLAGGAPGTLLVDSKKRAATPPDDPDSDRPGRVVD